MRPGGRVTLRETVADLFGYPTYVTRATVSLLTIATVARAGRLLTLLGR
jgi:hypothetical protein